MHIVIGSRVRAVLDLAEDIAEGDTGVVVNADNSVLPYFVHFDTGVHYWCGADDIEEYTQVFASHYQAQPIMDGPATANDDAEPASDTSLSGEELMNITRSFCR